MQPLRSEPLRRMPVPDPDLDLTVDEVQLVMPLDLEPQAGVDMQPASLGHPPALIRASFDDATDAVVPVDDGTLATAHHAAAAAERPHKEAAATLAI